MNGSIELALVGEVDGVIMPSTESWLHWLMWVAFKGRTCLLARIVRAVWSEIRAPKPVYGLQWGDPEFIAPLRYIRDRFIAPYIDGEHSALEIGPGGGRWTRYLSGFDRVYVVDRHEWMFLELRRNVDFSGLRFVRTCGTDFPGLAPASVDYVFTFDCFVHLEVADIRAYLKNLRPLLRPAANVVIHYSDHGKVMARINPWFSENGPDIMRPMVADLGYTIAEEDTTTLWHGCIMRLQCQE